MKIISFGKRLKQVREGLKLTQSEFARKYHCNNRRISYVESEVRGVSFLWINDIANKLDLLPVGFYFKDNEKWVLDTLSSKKFWQNTLGNYIGQIILKYRIKKGINQGELGKEVNLYTATISNYERGTHIPLSNNLEDTCEVLDIVPYYLLERLVRFDEEDHKLLRKVEFVLQQYGNLSNDAEEIRKIIVSAKKVEKANALLKEKYNTLTKRVIFHK